jgi:nucleotide-binding universal stress UspA family protein
VKPDQGETMFSNLVVGVDGREGGHAAVALAKQLSAPNAELILANFYGGEAKPTGGGPGVAQSPRNESERMLIRERRAAGVDARLRTLPGVEVGKGLARLAARHGADLVVVASCHHGMLGRVFLGNDASAALDHASCPVAIAPQGYTCSRRLSRIGVAYDGSSESVRAIEIARALAEQCDAQVSALMVVSVLSIPYDEPVVERLPRAAAELVDEERGRLHGLADVDSDIVYGRPGPELTRYSRDLDLLVLGSRRLGPVDRALEGSTSSYLIRHASCPLLVIPRQPAAVRQPAARGSRWDGLPMPAATAE